MQVRVPVPDEGRATPAPRARRSRRKPVAQTEMAATAPSADPPPALTTATLLPPKAPPPAQHMPPTPAYTGPTPANPFGSGALDIFDLLDQVESAPPSRRTPPPQLKPDRAVPANGAARPAAPPHEPELLKPDPIVGPAIQPVVIGAGEPTVEKKRGWWRK
jgi:hypothetical protein